MLQRICDRCGKIIQSGLNLKIDVKMVTYRDIGSFQTGVQGDGNTKRRVINPSETKQYELCKACKDELMTWLTKYEKLEDKIDA